MIIRYENLGAIGVIKDLPPHELHQSAWTDSLNMRFIDGRAEKFGGETNVFESVSSVAVEPYYIYPVQHDTAYFWIYGGLTKVYATDGAVHQDISRTASASGTGQYAMTADTRWNGGDIGGFVIVNNWQDDPQYWEPSLANKLASLPYDQSAGTTWATHTSYPRARVIRSFKQFLVALDVIESGSRNPRLLWWSHPAEPGTLPQTWDYSKPQFDAGQQPLDETNDFLIDCLPMRDDNVVYKAGSTWRMTYVNGPQVFGFKKEFESLGLLSVDCVKEFFGKHFVFGADDIVVHDLYSVKQILNRRMRSWLYNTIDSINYNRSFVVANYAKSEMWCCFPSAGSEWPDLALVWNWKDDTTSVRELHEIAHAGFGVVDPTLEPTTFDSGSGVTFDADSGPFDEYGFNPAARKLMLAQITTPKLLLADYGDTFYRTGAMSSYLERLMLPIGPQNTDGTIKLDLTSMKYVDAIYPRIDGNSGVQVNIYVGKQDKMGDSISWSLPYVYTVGTTNVIYMREVGRIISVRFEGVGTDHWYLDSYTLDVRMGGER